MININSVKDDIFEQALQTRDVKEFANVILNYKDDVTKEDFTLNFHGVSFTTEDCKFTNDFISKNEDALLKLDEILEQEEKEALRNEFGEKQKDYINGIRDFNIVTKTFELNNSEGFKAELLKLDIKIQSIKNSADISSLNLNGKEEKEAGKAVEYAITISDFKTIKEAVSAIDKLEESDAKNALLTSIITFIKNNINKMEEKAELEEIIAKYPIDTIEDLQNQKAKINNEIELRRQRLDTILNDYYKRNNEPLFQHMNSTNGSSYEIYKEISAKKEIERLKVAKDAIEEARKNTNVDTIENAISKLNQLTKSDEKTELVSDLISLINTYKDQLGLGKDKNENNEKSKIEKFIDENKNSEEIVEENDIFKIIPDVKVRKIINIFKAPVALIEKVRSNDFKSKLNNGLSKIKELASKISEYNNKIVTKYYTKRMEHAAKQEEKYAEKIEEMASKPSNPDIAVGMSR